MAGSIKSWLWDKTSKGKDRSISSPRKARSISDLGDEHCLKGRRIGDRFGRRAGLSIRGS